MTTTSMRCKAAPLAAISWNDWHWEKVLFKFQASTHPSSTRTTNRFSCNKRIWKIAANFPLANDGHASHTPTPCQERRWRFPCNQRWQSPGIRYARSIHILKRQKVVKFSIKSKVLSQKLTHAMNSGRFIQSLPTDVAEPSLVVRRLWPTMRDGILDQTRRNTRAWRDDIGDTFLMDNKVANCQNIQLTQNVIEFVTKIAVHRSEESFLFISNSVLSSLPMCWSIFPFANSFSSEGMTSTKAACIFPYHMRTSATLLFIHTISLRCVFFSSPRFFYYNRMWSMNVVKEQFLSLYP